MSWEVVKEEDVSPGWEVVDTPAPKKTGIFNALTSMFDSPTWNAFRRDERATGNDLIMSGLNTAASAVKGFATEGPGGFLTKPMRDFFERSAAARTLNNRSVMEPGRQEVTPMGMTESDLNLAKTLQKVNTPRAASPSMTAPAGEVITTQPLPIMPRRGDDVINAVAEFAKERIKHPIESAQSTMRAVETGVPMAHRSMARTGSQIGQLAADAVGAEDFSKGQDAYQKELDKADLIARGRLGSYLESIGAEAASQAIRQAPGMALYLVKGSPTLAKALGLTTFAEMPFAQGSAEMKQAGGGIAERILYGGLQGAQEAATEIPQMETLVRAVPAFKRGMSGQNLAKIMGFYPASAAMDTGGEVTSTLIGHELSRMIGQVPGDDDVKRDILNTVLQSLMQGGMQTGGAHAVARGGALAKDTMDKVLPVGMGDVAKAFEQDFSREFAPVTESEVRQRFAQDAPKADWTVVSEEPAGLPIQPMQVGEGGRRGEMTRDVSTEGAVTWDTLPDTALEAIAPKGFTVEDMREVGSKILASAESGGFGGSDWYKKSADYILDLFDGDMEQADEFIKLLAIASPQTEVSSNTTLATKAWDAFIQGKPLPELGLKRTEHANDLLYFGKDWSGLKTNTFYRNISEAMRNTDDGGFSTQDMHMGEMVFGTDKPSPKQYAAMEEATRLAAKVVGMLPRDLQAAAWVPQKARSLAGQYRNRGWKKDMSDKQLADYAFEIALRDYSHYLKQKGYVPGRSPATPQQRRDATTEVTAEFVPSPATREGKAIMALPIEDRIKYNKEMSKAVNLQGIMDAVGLNAAVRIETGRGGYMQGVQPNVIIELAPRSGNKADIDKRGVEAFALAWMYANKQNSVPFFRADSDMNNMKGMEVGVRFTFPKAVTQARMEQMMKTINEVMGPDAGFTEIGGEIHMINFPFMGKSVDQFLDEAKKVAQTYGAEINPYAAESVYPDEHDWQQDPRGNSLIERLKAIAPGRGNLQARLDRLAGPGRAITREYARRTGAPLKEVAQGLPLRPLSAEQVLPDGLIQATKSLLAEAPPVAKEEITREERVRATNMMRHLAEAADRNKPAFDNSVKQIAAKVGGYPVLAPNKTADRAAVKLVKENNWNTGKMKDFLRATVAVRTEEEAQAALKQIEATYTIDRVKDRFQTPTFEGYSDILVNVVMPDGSYGEIQISTPEMLAAKELAHLLYEVSRAHGAGLSWEARAAQLSKLIYGEARSASMSAENSSGVAGVPFRLAEAAGNLRGSGPKQTASMPSGDKATAFSSTSKSSQPFATSDFQSSTAKPSTGIVPRGGMPTNPVAQGTPAFKSWFKGSKVVDARGKPLVVYHGTAADIAAFDPSKAGSATGSFAQKAMFFTASPQVAEQFALAAGKLNSRQNAGGVWEAQGANLVPAYLSIKNPLVVTQATHLADYGYDGNYNPDVFATLIDEARAAGNDGVIFRRVGDMGSTADQFAVFEPTQIKSATGNTGGFDKANPDITRQDKWPFTGKEEAKPTGLYGPYAIEVSRGNAEVKTSTKTLDERTMARRRIQPLETQQRSVLNDALADLKKAGIPGAWMESGGFYGLKPLGLGYAIYSPADSAIAVDFTHLDKAAADPISAINVRGWLAHELHHLVDNYRNSSDRMYYLSSESPRMDLEIPDFGRMRARGDLMAEALDLWGGNTELADYLDYPFMNAQAYASDNGVGRDYAQHFAKIEVFAQMGALWATNPALVERVASKWAAMFKEWENARGTGSIAASRQTLRGILSKPDTAAGVAGRDGRQGQQARDAGQDQRSLAVAGARPGVGQVRAGAGDGRGRVSVPTAEAQARAAGFLANPKRPIPGDHVPTHVNYSVTNTPDEVKQVLSTLSNTFEKEIQQQRRGTVTWQQTEREMVSQYSDLLGIGAEGVGRILVRKPGTPAGAAELRARLTLMTQAAEALESQAESIRQKVADKVKIEPQELADFAAQLDRAGMITSMFLGARAEAGRALNILRNTQRAAEHAQAVSDIIAQYKGPENLQQIAVMLGTFTDPSQTLAFAKKAQKMTVMDAIIEAWLASLLSGPITHQVNVTSNLIFNGLRIPEQFVAGLFGKMHGGDKVYLGETLALTMGMMLGSTNAMKQAAQTFITGEMQGDIQSHERRGAAIRGETFGLTGKTGKAVDIAGEIIRTPFRALSAEDAFFRTINEEMTLYTMATRQALSEGKQYWHSDFKTRVAALASEARIARAHGETVAVSAEARKIADEMERSGLRYTFNEKLGKTGQAYQRMTTEAPALKFITPFVRTPINIVKQGMRRTLVAPLMPQWQEDFKAGGAKRDVALAQVVVGTAIQALVVSAVAAGLFTGGGDPEREAKARRREQGVLDYAIKINGKWYEYRRLEPFGILLGLAADGAEIWRYMGKEEKEHFTSMMAMAMAQNLTSKTFLSGIANTINSISDPERYGDRWIQGYYGSVIPGIVGQVAQQRDKVIRDTGIYGEEEMSAIEKQVESFKRAVQARIPKTALTPEFNSETLPPKRDTWGEAQKRKERVWPYGPIQVQEEYGDKVRDEAQRLGIKNITLPKEVLSVKLNPEQYSKWGELNGKTAKDVMDTIVGDPSWEDIPDWTKKQIFDNVSRAVRKGAAPLMIPEIGEDKFIDAQVQKNLKKYGGGYGR